MNAEKICLGKVSLTICREYIPGLEYERLTIVPDYKRYKCYLSLRDVPAGIPLTDIRFWMPFSSLDAKIVLDYNTFIAKFTKYIKDTDSKLNELIEKVEELVITGGVFKQELGTNTTYGISQKVITDEFNKIYQLLNEKHMSNNKGIFTLNVPKLVLENGVYKSDITVNVLDEFEVDSITIYKNGNILSSVESSNVLQYNYNNVNSESFEITVKVVIGGVAYYDTAICTYDYKIYVGSTYPTDNDIINTGIITDNIAKKLDVEILVHEDSPIYFAYPNSKEELTVILNNFNIDVEKISDFYSSFGNYSVFKTIDTFVADTYNFIIN